MILTSMIASLALAPTWSIGSAMQLVWEGKDYTPIGLQVQANKAQIEEAMLAGIQDFNVEVPISSSWKEVADQLEGRRFFLTNTTLMPVAKGITIQPQYYRMNGIRNPQKIRVSLPGSEKAFVVVALHTGELLTQKLYPVTNGTLSADLAAAKEADQIVLIYPIGESMQMEDLWDRMDERRDQALRQIRGLGKSDGLRGIINPLGTTVNLPAQDSGFVPLNNTFRKEFADFLEDKYKNLATLLAAWGMRASVADNFGDVVKFVPLWNSGRGVEYFLDVDNGQTQPASNKKSTYWNDLAQSISKARSRRAARIIRSIRKASGVPVFQDWTGWSWFFENPDNELSGLSIRLNKLTPNSLLSSTSQALSSNLRSRQPGPIFAVDVPMGPELNDPGVLSDMTQYGVRGLFLRASGAEQLAKLSKMSFAGGMETMIGFYYPQNASNPAQAQKIAGNLWWLPSPADGNRLDLGNDLSGYEIASGTTSNYVIWNNGPRKMIELRLKNAGTTSFQSLSGATLSPTLTKSGINIMLDPTPVLVTNATHCPIPESELIKVERELGNLLEVAVKLKKNISEETFEVRNFDDLITANPQKALLTAQKTIRKVGAYLAGASWLEYEATSKHLFSEVVKDAGCSNGGYLSLRTPLGEATGPIHATVAVPQRFQGNVDVWVGARIPNPSDRQRIKFKFGGQVMTIKGEPISLYGSGFGWYNVGATRLSQSVSAFTAEVNGVPSTDISLDCVLFTPVPFQPNNVRQPEFSFPEGKAGQKLTLGR